MSQIQQFYAGQNIFITGGTGFLGKMLTEKLLRSCREIGTIYLLIRGKKGKSVEERRDALLAESVFDVLRKDQPNFFEKIVCIVGDVAEERFGLTVTDYARLVDEVSVIFHLAATVHFNEKLEVALSINVKSVKSVIDIARECKNLKVGVYVSTAYSHCVRKAIDEKLYPSPCESYEEVKSIISKAKADELSEDMTMAILGKWPNTYSFSKAIAEGVVDEFAKDLPFAIFRPSIVSSSYEEPTPGWMPSPIGMLGIVYAYILGIMHVISADPDAVADIIPVDYTCNALISCAWASSKKCHYKDVSVYNYVSGKEKPIIWKQFVRKFDTAATFYPSEKAIYHHFCMVTKSKLLFYILEMCFQLIPALIIDKLSTLLGKQSQLYKVISKIGIHSRIYSYFSIREWDFENREIQQLWKQLEPEDKKIFPFSMETVDWDEYCLFAAKGFRKFISLESDANLEQARQKHRRLFIVHQLLSMALGILILWVVWKLFGGFYLMFSTVYQLRATSNVFHVTSAHCLKNLITMINTFIITKCLSIIPTFNMLNSLVNG
ncbi:fatty acyl-CoA reductase wat-like [Diprion similis]|uniref:fatty acyl-CoA reductase wat-like n=1 Tax=Diprion similis TaxID=362088 RepID=UPI001EF7C345|nr:fatty acyl-CoA reductase wat-like [Diprion similis]